MPKNVIIDGTKYVPESGQKDNFEVGDVVEAMESMNYLGVARGDRGVVIDIMNATEHLNSIGITRGDYGVVKEKGFIVTFVSPNFLAKHKKAYFYKEDIHIILRRVSDA